jgi:hypothetical protein
VSADDGRNTAPHNPYAALEREVRYLRRVLVVLALLAVLMAAGVIISKRATHGTGRACGSVPGEWHASATGWVCIPN